jgi:hypothetical protein
MQRMMEGLGGALTSQLRELGLEITGQLRDLTIGQKQVQEGVLNVIGGSISHRTRSLPARAPGSGRCF